MKFSISHHNDILIFKFKGCFSKDLCPHFERIFRNESVHKRKMILNLQMFDVKNSKDNHLFAHILADIVDMNKKGRVKICFVPFDFQAFLNPFHFPQNCVHPDESTSLDSFYEESQAKQGLRASF